jgi:hypothetical protein
MDSRISKESKLRRDYTLNPAKAIPVAETGTNAIREAKSVNRPV